MRKLFFSLIVLIGFLPGLVFADSPSLKNAFGNGGKLDAVSGNAGFTTGADPSGAINPIISNTISIVLSFLGVIFLLLAIRAGYLWMTAQGDAKKVEEAKDILTRAVIGLIVVVSAYAISAYVIQNFAGFGLDSTMTDNKSN